MDDPIQEIQNNELLSRFLRRTGVEPFVAALLLALINLVLNVGIAAVLGAWSPSETRTWLNRAPTWVNHLLLQPLIIGYFCWIQYGGQQLFRQLADEGILESEEHLGKEIAKCRDRFRAPWLPRVAAGLGIFVAVGGVLAISVNPGDTRFQSWIGAHPLIVLVRFPITFVGIYALCILIYDLVIIVVTLYALLKDEKIRVKPLDLDNAGGMGMIGHFAADLGYGFGVIWPFNLDSLRKFFGLILAPLIPTVISIIKDLLQE